MPDSRGDPTRVSRQAAVADLARAALCHRDVKGVFSLAVDLVCEVLGTEYAEVLHQPAPGEALVLMAGRGREGHLRAGEMTVPWDRDSLVGYTMLQGEPVLVEDLEVDNRFTGRQLLRDRGLRSGMSVVIQGRDGPYGVLGAPTTTINNPSPPRMAIFCDPLPASWRFRWHTGGSSSRSNSDRDTTRR